MADADVEGAPDTEGESVPTAGTSSWRHRVRRWSRLLAMGYTAALMGACGLLLGRASDYFDRIGLSAFDGFGRALSSDALEASPGQALLFASPVLLGAGLLAGAVLLGLLRRWDWPVLVTVAGAVAVIVVVGLVDEGLHQIEGRYYAKSRYVADVMGVARPVRLTSFVVAPLLSVGWLLQLVFGARSRDGVPSSSSSSAKTG